MKQSIPPKPEGAQWTDDQWKAITARGMDILVAAAAGSGKTAVLVERIIRKVMDKDQPVDVDRLLIVTFTNAAAAEMRHRIGEALEKAISENPASLHLRRQLSLLNRASISTLHSFCLEVIRKYYYLINIDPTFRIAEDTEAQLIREEVMEELFEEEYGTEGNDAFFDVVDRYTGDRNDSDLQVMVRKLYDESRAHPNPEGWLQGLLDAYVTGEETKVNDLPFLSVIKQDIHMQLDGARAMLQQALELTRIPGGPAPRAVTIEEDLKQLYTLEEAYHSSWEKLYDTFQQLKFSQLKTVKGDEYDELLKEQVKDLREQAKNAVKQIKEDFFDRKPESYLNDIKKMKPSIETLTQLVHKFGERYEKVKLSKSLVDFADLEHYCLNILRELDAETEGYVPSAAAHYFKRHFNEVLVDEYQDTNYVQESIIRSVCKDQPDPGNLFMVGDVKQSIYRFRLAEPGLFLKKYKLFSPDGNEYGLRIDLSQNFRSRPEVLDGTNYIFKQIMDEQVGEIAYDEHAELKLGANYPDHVDTKAELLIINHDGEEQLDSEEESGFDPVELETVQLEARLMAGKIKGLIQQRYQVFDKKLGTMRDITYRDIVILLRSMPWAPQIMDEFKQHGIPVYADLSSGYFEATEVSIMMSLLRVIDNPYQDIPLAAILRSPIVGLSADELAMIRLKEKKGPFYDAVKLFLENGATTANNQTYEKLMEFHLMLQKWRRYARLGSLSELIWRIYQKTGYYDFVGGMPGGKQRQANLRALYDRARQYESTSFRGLFRFLRFIERMQDRGDDLGTARALGEQEDVIRIMTIHKSKGLEFPVVFVAGLSKPFNVRDLNSTFLLHKDLGFGSKYIDPTLRISYPTLPQLAIRQKIRNEMLAEEMRVLYVALTRAKEKLFLIGTVKRLEKKREQWNQQLHHNDWLLPSYERSKAKCYIDWIAPSLIRHNETTSLREEQILSPSLADISSHPSRWELTLVDPRQLDLAQQQDSGIDETLLKAMEKGEKLPLEGEYKSIIENRLTWEYDYKTASVHRSKQSVSEIKRMREVHDAYSETSLIKPLKKPITDRPRFLQEKSLTPAEKGTAMHMVMQHIPLDQPVSEEGVHELLSYMVVNELLTEEQATHINVNGIVTFFKTDIGQRILGAKEVMREVPFSIGLPATEVYPDWEGETETILLQGVIDLLFEDEQGSVLLDFKTDVTKSLPDDLDRLQSILRDRYEVQVELYSKAIEQIWKKPLQEKYLYFFDGEHLVKL
ncbi:ATP-dependent helicase/nuclease subunit A [Bacillus mesophilus]|uniref:ATP-dependent helicase/nuclease subunit A n=1 Tax=Bacillus mesophilus TaxID=1808955 RepID=A0A6M0Q4H0_9BACI|nr:helicase-exonuclease AddAB subunit AddA [Bacillus mesophilus]MBM7659820.1 ATP-dependent helicase/nuclease subunit A [Bacillus mesophilus]NEY70679.1 helicase-exonuclease AddAB subunit AddA [Bacillus mesophilus]